MGTRNGFGDAAKCEPSLGRAVLSKAEADLRHSGKDFPHLRESLSLRAADRRPGSDGRSPAVPVAGPKVRAAGIQGTGVRIPVRPLVTFRRAFRILVTRLAPG